MFDFRTSEPAVMPSASRRHSRKRQDPKTPVGVRHTGKSKHRYEALQKAQTRLALSMGAGVLLGLFIGFIIGNFAFTIGTGLALGLAVGILAAG